MAKIEIVRLVVAIANFKGCKLFKLDVKYVFLNRWLKEEVYVEQPQMIYGERKIRC